MTVARMPHAGQRGRDAANQCSKSLYDYHLRVGDVKKLAASSLRYLLPTAGSSGAGTDEEQRGVQTFGGVAGSADTDAVQSDPRQAPPHQFAGRRSLASGAVGPAMTHDSLVAFGGARII